MSGDLLRCRHCKREFDTLANLEQHLTTEHPDPPSSARVSRHGLIDETVAFDCYD